MHRWQTERRKAGMGRADDTDAVGSEIEHSDSDRGHHEANQCSGDPAIDPFGHDNQAEYRRSDPYRPAAHATAVLEDGL